MSTTSRSTTTSRTTKKTTARTTVKKTSRKRAPSRGRATAKQKPKQQSATTTKLSLMALSPYRFPIDVERLAVQTARVGGFAFVFLGLVFTYHYIETATTGLVVNATQTASVAATAVDPRAQYTPPVTFTYTQTDAEHMISIDVAKAEHITVFVFDPRTEQYTRLGDATQQPDGTWQYEWDTTRVTPGDYWIKAMVENRHGTYDRSDSKYLRVQ